MRKWAPIAVAMLFGCGRPGAEDLPAAVIDADWAQVPQGVEWGQVTAVDVDSHGHIFVLQRGSREWAEPFPSEPIAQDTIFMFASNGRLLGSFGDAALVMPHGLSVDDEDNVWVTDAGREQVIRFGHDGGEQDALGERGVPGSGPGMFGRPTDIAFDGERMIVSDGYTNARLAIFDRLGDFVEEYGEAGSGKGQFALPHSVALDEDFIYVADRENRRVQVFDMTGQAVGERGQRGTGYPYAVAALGGGWLVVAEGRDAGDRSSAVIRVYRPDGELVKAFDAGLEDGSSRAHDIAMGTDGSLYMTDVTGGRIVKIDLARSGEAEEQ